jgi:hypothetical protein
MKMTDSEYLGWMNKSWYIQSVTPGTYDLGVATTDRLTFTSTTVELQKSGETSTSIWGTSCQVTSDGLTGVRSLDGRPFLMQLNSGTGQVTCTFPDTTQQRRIMTVALGSLVGTLVGFVTGFAFGFGGRGAVVGAVAAFTGSLVGNVSSANLRDGATPIFVVQDGGPVGRPNLSNPGPQPVRAVSA